jgi:hypothetical protein
MDVEKGVSVLGEVGMGCRNVYRGMNGTQNTGINSVGVCRG